jgi:hypothetical protein
MDRNLNAMGNWNGARFQEMSIPNSTGWHHYAVAFENGMVSMYWDGQPQLPSTGTPSSAAATAELLWIVPRGQVPRSPKNRT